MFDCSFERLQIGIIFITVADNQPTLDAPHHGVATNKLLK